MTFLKQGATLDCPVSCPVFQTDLQSQLEFICRDDAVLVRQFDVEADAPCIVGDARHLDGATHDVNAAQAVLDVLGRARKDAKDSLQSYLLKEKGALLPLC